MKYFSFNREIGRSTPTWKKIVLVIALVMVGVYLVFIGGYFVTSIPSFCAWCHQIKPYVISWKQSAHKNVNCLYCHEYEGFLGKLNAKMRGINNTYKQITGQYTITAQGTIFEQNCIGCHLGDNRKFSDAKRLDMKHYEYIKDDKSCLQCHKDIGHQVNIFSQQKFKK